jgi:DNA-binding response OmpR family regulator
MTGERPNFQHIQQCGTGGNGFCHFVSDFGYTFRWRAHAVEGERMRVLVVEDERRVALSLCQALLEESFAVDMAYDGLQALDLARSHDYDAIVLDLMLPGMDGLNVCRRLREDRRRTPVLMLSARDLVEDRVRGLDAGADDYLVKPFAVQELMARLRALLRRQSQVMAPRLKIGNLELDPSTHTAHRGGRPIPLTPREYALLEYLMRRPGIIHTRTMIAEHVWDFPFDHASNVVDVYIKHLRDKLDEEGQASFIQAVRGVGYVLAHPEPSAAS